MNRENVSVHIIAGFLCCHTLLLHKLLLIPVISPCRSVFEGLRVYILVLCNA